VKYLDTVLVPTGLALVVVLVMGAVLAPVLAPYDPKDLVGSSLAPPSSRHLLGTNDVGQDIFSQLVWGSRASLLVGVGAATLSTVVGVLIGLIAALRGGLVDVLVMRLVDVFLAMPMLPLLIVVAAFTGTSLVTLIGVVGVMAWPVTARIVRSQALSLRAAGFVDAAQGFGGGLVYVVRRHLVPALGPIVVIGFANVAAMAVMLEAGLAFLGLGDPGRMSWGLVLNRALDHPGIYFSSVWVWWMVPAGAAITVAVLGFTFLGVGLEPRFNPRWSRSL
jgi:ABC-type dipeptide/oligopeptide/nickel transport system permease subunit